MTIIEQAVRKLKESVHLYGEEDENDLTQREVGALIAAGEVLISLHRAGWMPDMVPK